MAVIETFLLATSLRETAAMTTDRSTVSQSGLRRAFGHTPSGKLHT